MTFQAGGHNYINGVSGAGLLLHAGNVDMVDDVTQQAVALQTTADGVGMLFVDRRKQAADQVASTTPARAELPNSSTVSVTFRSPFLVSNCELGAPEDHSAPQRSRAVASTAAGGRSLSRYTRAVSFASVRLLMALDDILLEAEEKMSKTEQVVLHEFTGVRTGKASPALIENVIVDAYGSQMRIRELAGITTPEPRMLVIQPWDASMIHPIEKALQKANLGMNPAIHGKSVRLYFPELSQERRAEFVKIARKMAEDGRVAIRHVRRDAMDELKKHAHDSGVTEDEEKKAEKELQKLTDDYTGKIDAHLALKEKEIMTV